MVAGLRQPKRGLGVHSDRGKRITDAAGGGGGTPSAGWDAYLPQPSATLRRGHDRTQGVVTVASRSMRTIDDLLANNARFVEDFPAGRLEVRPSRPDGRVFGDLDGQPFAAGECLEEIRRAERRGGDVERACARRQLVEVRHEHRHAGLLRHAREDRRDFRNLKLHTGDLGRMDADGYFYFMDRVKDYIRRRGEERLLDGG